ncbi:MULTISPECIES: class F sortase [unclassified Micromonospora]|uniref:class F sortase n=1 Tax=unclassified Micromonospora TaxID=2617518 RepID=UPI0020B433D6|nr:MULTISPECIES: class F sortase [unclassified Micromonospora]MDM4782346.1 class F sortase [Micromonospora sp. b486]
MAGAGLIGASVRTVPPSSPPQPISQAAPVTTEPQADPAGIATGPDTEGPDAAGQPAPGSTGQPTADAAGGGNGPATPGALGAAGATGPAPAPLPRSAPVTISIPRIGVQAPIMSLGTNPDGTVQVPPLDQAMKAGWYSPGASPGEAGNAVIVGHVDSAQLGPAVFFNLGALVPGDTIVVTRQDGASATFTVREVGSYPKTAFPAAQVYGPSDVPTLRVVTCGGVFDRTAGSYLNNIVVYAPMTS